MLYVFQVDTGTMLTFEMNLALDSVATLQTRIHTHHNIPPSSQVLLVSGGDSPQPSTRVCNYTSGTDTNPIFLFNKQNIESTTTPTVIGDQEISIEIEDSLPSYATLVQRSNQAQSLYESCREILQKSETLIHDQHLQHQGWAAVVANLEDIVSLFRKKIDSFEIAFRQDVDNVDLDLVESLPTTIQNLSTLKLPTNQTLLNWLTSFDQSILELPQKYQKTLEILDKPAIHQIIKEAQNVLEKATQNSMKEIKGLSTRLYKLDELLEESKKLLKENLELKNSLITTTSRAKEDRSILPDLCNSHRTQLELMVSNLKKLEDIKRRCLRAKEELVTNLIKRLKWVMFVQKSISEINLKISVYYESLKKFKLMKSVVKQVLDTEQVFNECLDEVKRREFFEKKYNSELRKVTKKFSNDFDGEVKLREKFKLKNCEHFLYNSLFASLDYVPVNLFEPVKSEFTEDASDSEELDDADKLKQEIVKLKEVHSKELEELREQLKLKYECELEEAMVKSKSDLEAVKSRVKFFGSLEDNINSGINSLIANDCDKFDKLESPGEVVELAKKLKVGEGCRIGDVVLIYHSKKYDAFVVHNSNSIHFIHTDSVKDLCQDCYYTGCVVDKEYCVARRAQNRYKVPQGFHFYRVKIRIIDTIK